MSKILYDVIMLSHNQTELTMECVRSLREMKERDHIRLIWVDNGSTMKHQQNVITAIHDANYSATWVNDNIDYHFMENQGFPKATNLGIALSTAPYVIFLNDDVVLRSGVFDTMRKAIESTEKAMLACTVSTSGWQHYDKLEKRGWIKALPPSPNNSLFDPIVSTPRILDREEHPAFFCTMITRECIQKIGYLSEEMGEGFGEDDDYNERIHAAGYKRLICLDAFVEHKHRATWKSIKSDKEIRESQLQSMGVLKAKYGECVW